MNPVYLPVGRSGKLIYIQTDRFKSELLSVSFLLPLTAANAQKNAMLMALSRRGTVRFPTQALLNRRLDELYSTAVSSFNRRIGDMQSIGFVADFLGEKYVGGAPGLLPDVVGMLSDLLLSPVTDNEGKFLSEYLESEKNNLLDALHAEINNPKSYAAAQCRKLLCAGEPYALSLIGEEEQVPELTPQSVTDRYREFLTEVSPIFCYVGNTPAERLISLLSASFEDFGGKNPDFCTEIGMGAPQIKRAEKSMPLCQGKLSIGFRTDVTQGHELAPAAMVFNEIFGGSPASKLFLNVREKKSLCYYCGSSLDLFKGAMLVNSGMKVENRAATEASIFDEFDQLRRGNITKIEFDAAQKSLLHAFRQIYDNPGVLARYYTSRLFLGDKTTAKEWREKVGAVTPSDISEFARHIRPGVVFFLNGTRVEEDAEEE